MDSNETIRPTRYEELGYRQDGPSLWRIYDTESEQAIGPQYTTRTELLSDLERYAGEYGCEFAGRPTVDPTGQCRTGAARWHAKRAQEQALEGRVRERLEAHLTKAWDSLARYKFERFGYHAAAWVQLAQLLEPKPENPFRAAVKLARIDYRLECEGSKPDRLDRIDELLKEISPLWNAVVCRCGSSTDEG